MAEPLTLQLGTAAVGGVWTWAVTDADTTRADEILLFRNGVAVPYANGEIAVTAAGVTYTPTLAVEDADEVWGTYIALGGVTSGAPGQGAAGRRIRDRATALARLQDLVPITVAPALTASELDRCLDNALVATVWAAGTVTQHGDRVVPVEPNGGMWQCGTESDSTAGGTTGQDEPDWLNFTIWPGTESAYITDNDILWYRVGAEPHSLWDLRQAAHAGWRMKAGKASASISSAAGKLKAECNQIYEQCAREARRFAPGGFA